MAIMLTQTHVRTHTHTHIHIAGLVKIKSCIHCMVLIWFLN